MFEITDTQKQIRDAAAKLAGTVIQPRAADVDKTEEYPWDNVKALTDAGFMGMTIPKAYGGQGASYLDAVLVVEEMAKVCGVTARIVVEGNMGAIGAIMAYGTEDQKKIAAGLVLAGDKPAICITEPGAGSAASEMSTRADKTNDGYVLNGSKHWITGGGVSKLHLIFARVFEDDKAQGIAGFLCVRDQDQGILPEGLIIGAREPAMGLRGIPEMEIIFEDLHIPAEMVLVPPQGLRHGFAGLMTAYNAQRVGAAMVALGIAQGAYELALEYTQTREQFSRPIAEFQGLQWMLVDMRIAIDAARLMIYKAATGTDGETGFPDITDAASAKIMAAEVAIKATNDALQVFGAAGYSRNLPLERMVRDARMFTIGGGTAQILRTVVAGQILGRKLPQTRDGHLKLAEKEKTQDKG
jgi:hypothetical protein